MGRRRGFVAPFEAEVTGLGPKGQGIGTSPDGREVRIRGAAPGTRVMVRPTGRKRGVILARRQYTVRPAVSGVEPRCPVFGLCGGCSLQELLPEAQRTAKAAAVLRDVAPGPEVTVHPARAASSPWGYRNKVELSFGLRRYLSEADNEAGAPIDGRFLGFHAPGRWDRVVDVAHCDLVDAGANAIVTVVRERVVEGGATPMWDPREHTGFWRHLVLRQGQRTGERVVLLITAPPGEFPEAVESVEQLALALRSLVFEDGSTVVGVQWRVNDGVADVARGEVERTWGSATWREKLGAVEVELGPESFFQSSTPGAEVLYSTVEEALGEGGGTLVDLYCGVGSIGLFLAHRYAFIAGVEEVAAAVDDARKNAAANGVRGAWRVARVEDALDALDEAGPVDLVVDPPRAGLHPKVARRLALTEARSLVYVACNPAALARDNALLAVGWRMTDLWTVDMFPQTGHIEAVARFVRRPS